MASVEEKGAVELRGNRHRARVDCDCRFDDRALKLGYAKIIVCTSRSLQPERSMIGGIEFLLPLPTLDPDRRVRLPPSA